MENGDHISRREVGLIVDTVRQEAKTLEQRLTVRMVVAVVGANAVATFLSPSVTATLAAVGVAGWAVKKGLLLVFLR